MDPRKMINIGGDEEGVFKTRITDLKIVERKTKTGHLEPMLRFSLLFMVRWGGRSYGGKILGCLAHKYYNYDTNEPVVLWSPPKTRNGSYFHVNMAVTPDWYEIVKEGLIRSGYMEYVGSPKNYTTAKERKVMLPDEIDPSLPLTFDVVGNVGDVTVEEVKDDNDEEG